jgi:hypothetical protein
VVDRAGGPTSGKSVTINVSAVSEAIRREHFPVRTDQAVAGSLSIQPFEMSRNGIVQLGLKGGGYLKRAGNTLDTLGSRPELASYPCQELQPRSQAGQRRRYRQFGDRASAIVLTGCLTDGATGAGAVRRNGGRVFVQAPADCEHSDMPIATMVTGAVDFALPLKILAAAITAILMNSGIAELFRVADSYRLLIANSAPIGLKRQSGCPPGRAS